MDIEERAGKWATEKLASERADSYVQDIHPWLVAAYLAGSVQTQADYSGMLMDALCTQADCPKRAP